jgi:hypothetical protein
MSWFRQRVAEIRPEYARADPADRLEHRPGRVVQCDLWFPPTKIALGFDQVGCPPVLVMVAAFSRFLTAAMLPSRQTWIWLWRTDLRKQQPRAPSIRCSIVCHVSQESYEFPWADHAQSTLI